MLGPGGYDARLLVFRGEAVDLAALGRVPCVYLTFTPASSVAGFVYYYYWCTVLVWYDGLYTEGELCIGDSAQHPSLYRPG